MLDLDQALLLIAGLPQGGPVRLRWMLNQVEDPTECISWLKEKRYHKVDNDRPRGLTNDLLDKWKFHVSNCDLDGLVTENKRLGISVLSQWSEPWPFVDDIEPPVVLFAKGNLELLSEPAVAIVGTRRCTSVGRKVATDFANSLVASGVVVVSGLAAGIDKAAHVGALKSTSLAVAVVGSGIDQIYPKSNAALWNQVSKDGLLLSEYGLGVTPKKWHFPARNRLIASLSSGTVVIESHEKGGSLSTAEEAMARDRALMAVPGSILSAASKGSNALIADGAIPVTSPSDILSATFGLDFDAALEKRSTNENNEEPSLDQIILSEARSGSGSLDQVFNNSDATVDEVFLRVHKLTQAGQIKLVGSRLDVA